MPHFSLIREVYFEPLAGKARRQEFSLGEGREGKGKGGKFNLMTTPFLFPLLEGEDEGSNPFLRSKRKEKLEGAGETEKKMEGESVLGANALPSSASAIYILKKPA